MFQDNKDVVAPSKSKAMSRLTSRKRSAENPPGGGSPSVQSKRAKGPSGSRPPPPPKRKSEDLVVAPFDKEDIIGSGDDPILARKVVHRPEKSGRHPFTAITESAAGQPKLTIEEKKKGT